MAATETSAPPAHATAAACRKTNPRMSALPAATATDERRYTLSVSWIDAGMAQSGRKPTGATISVASPATSDDRRPRRPAAPRPDATATAATATPHARPTPTYNGRHVTHSAGFHARLIWSTYEFPR